jgi:hypothetical protein
LLSKLSLYFVATSNFHLSIKFESISTALCKYHHQLSLKSIIIHLVFSLLNLFKISENSREVFSQNKFNDIYQISSSHKSIVSTEGILILSLIISLVIISLSQALSIFKITFVQAGHFIRLTASFTVKSFKDFQLASIIISHFNIQLFKAGLHFNTLSTITHNSFLLITAHIHSKSQLKVSSNCFVASGVINSENLSHKELTNHVITQYSKSFSFNSSME